jgi:hypothetical protein
MNRTRRAFLGDVGKGMLVASIGPVLASDLGLAAAHIADDEPVRLNFGKLDPLVRLMQETPADKLQPMLVDRLKSGTPLRDLVSAGALANARTLGGHNYDGYHTFMALSPAWEMAQELPDERRALPILKVLYRNASVIQRSGAGRYEMLLDVKAAELPEGRAGGDVFRDAAHKGDMAGAESAFVALTQKSLPDAYNDLQTIVQDEVDVHRVVLAWRAWAMLDLAGKEQANTFLRQSVHYCVKHEQGYNGHKPTALVRKVLPKLLDQYKLIGKTLGDRKADDAWIEKMCQTIYAGDRSQGAEAVAAALAEGFGPESIAEALCLAANRLVLCDGGRPEPVGTKSKYSVHGDSTGVHASDSANAWRNIARVTNPRNTVASLIVGGFHTAGQSRGQQKDPYPNGTHLEAVKSKDAAPMLHEIEEAIKGRDQALVCAIVHRYGELGHAARPLLDILLKFAISEDGALHAEKYYRTATEEFALTRPAFRWRQLVALARVTASEFGQPAPGYAESCKLLKV